jgi:hypothetical protein
MENKPMISEGSPVKIIVGMQVVEVGSEDARRGECIAMDDEVVIFRDTKTGRFAVAEWERVAIWPEIPESAKDPLLEPGRIHRAPAATTTKEEKPVTVDPDFKVTLPQIPETSYIQFANGKPGIFICYDDAMELASLLPSYLSPRSPNDADIPGTPEHLAKLLAALRDANWKNIVYMLGIKDCLR